MKNKLRAILGATAVLALMSATLPEPSIARCSGSCVELSRVQENVFLQDSRISQMNQADANAFCRGKFAQLKATGDLGGGFDPNAVNHVWAHLANGVCIANT
jgi:hypothetical protein